MENVVVWETGTVAEPETGRLPESSPSVNAGVKITEVALVVAQVNVVVWPALTDVGLAVSDVICGGGGGASGVT
jgi:hypothetical protein